MPCSSCESSASLASVRAYGAVHQRARRDRVLRPRQFKGDFAAALAVHEERRRLQTVAIAHTNGAVGNHAVDKASVGAKRHAEGCKGIVVEDSRFLVLVAQIEVDVNQRRAGNRKKRFICNAFKKKQKQKGSKEKNAPIREL